MQLTSKIDIENGIVTASVKCTDISEDTLEALNDYPKYIRYGDIDFFAKIKVADGTMKPEIVANDDPDGEKVSINLIDKSIRLDENFEATLSIDASKISETELTTTIKSVEILSKAKALVFIEKITEKAKEIVEQARLLNNPDIEGETETII